MDLTNQEYEELNKLPYGQGGAMRSHAYIEQFEVRTLAQKPPNRDPTFQYSVSYPGGMYNDGRFNTRDEARLAGFEKAKELLVEFQEGIEVLIKELKELNEH